jgi:hypothetical protein
LRRDISCCKLFKKLSFVPIGISMSGWRLVEYKGSATLHFFE